MPVLGEVWPFRCHAKAAEMSAKKAELTCKKAKIPVLSEETMQHDSNIHWNRSWHSGSETYTWQCF